MFGSLRAAFEDVVDSGIGLLAQVPGLADAAESAREALTPFRSSLSENGWPKGHRVEIAGKIFVIESLLGEGGFACVYAVRSLDTGELFALKRVVAASRECLEAARREVAAASKASSFSSSPSSSAGLLPLVASSEVKVERNSTAPSSVEVLMLFPFCAGGSLADAKQRQQQRRCRERERQREHHHHHHHHRQQHNDDDDIDDRFLCSLPLLLLMFADVAEGLSRLHAAGMGHFDVKPHNVFLRRSSSSSSSPSAAAADATTTTATTSPSSSPPPPYRALLGDFGSARGIPLRFRESSSKLSPSSSEAPPASSFSSPSSFSSSSSSAAAAALPSYLVVTEEAERNTTAAYRPPELHDPLSFAAPSSSCSSSSSSSSPPSSSSSSSSGGEREIDGKADVWAIGAALFSALGDGRSPSEVAAGAGEGTAGGGGGGSLSLAACSGKVEWPASSFPPPPSLSSSPSSLSPSSLSSPFLPSSSSLVVPSAVKALVERCLSTDPRRRPSSRELASELRELSGRRF